MFCASRFVASASVASLLILGTSTAARAQRADVAPVQPIGRVASFAPGSLRGMVHDERGMPVEGVVVSALGSTTTVAITDQNGRFEFGTLAPGPYLVRAHLTGYVAPRAQMVQVRASAGATSAIELRRSSALPVMTAGFDTLDPPPAPQKSDKSADPAPANPPSTHDSSDDEPSEVAWRLRHARRGVLKDVTIPDELLAGADSERPSSLFVPVQFLGWAVGTPARAASSFFGDTPFSGQVNLLATGSFDTPQRLFSNDTAARNITYVRLGAPVGEQGDWTVRAALTQADISAWIVAGSYSTRAPARHRYDVGLSYSTQRYDGANPLALRDLTDGSRNAGTLYAYDSFAIASAATLTFGTAYARYDYLSPRGLISPRAELTISPVERLRISGVVSQRALAPGAEEFLPPGDTGIWMPPQRTFSSLDPTQPLRAEHTMHAAVAVERDLGVSTIGVRGFRQEIDDQLATVFGEQLPNMPAATLGHYVVGTAGDANVSGCTAEFRSVIANRVHGAVSYTIAAADLSPSPNVRYLMLLAPSALRHGHERIHDLSTTLETTVPETATRVLVVYRVSDGFADPVRDGDSAGRPGFDSRFDVQVRQSLPFMNFSNARWEMLVAVRNFFREAAAEQSIYDELLVVRPPKRLVGGVTLHF